MIQKIHLLWVLFGFSFCLSAQTPSKKNYYVQGYLELKEGSTIFEQPFTGGFNSIQFQPMDINNDGIMDIICFEKSDNKLLPFIRKSGSSFRYAPEYEVYFPPGNYYYKTADLNADGKLDIFTLDETSSLIIHKNISTPGDSVPTFQDLGPMIYRNQYMPPFPILYNQLSLSKMDLPEIADIDGDGDMDIITYDQSYQVYKMFSDVRADFGWSKDTFEFQIMDICFGYFNDFGNTINLGSCPYMDKLKPRHSGGASILMFDNDADGDKEMVISNVGIRTMTFIKNGKKEFNRDYDTMVAFDTIFPNSANRACTYLFPAGFLVDVDGDTIKDLITAPNGFADVKETNQIWYYRNQGKNNKPDFKFQQNNFLAEKTFDLGAKTAPAFADYDGDGDMDLFVANNGDFEITGGSKDRIALYQNVGTKSIPRYNLVTKDYLAISSMNLGDMIVSFGDVDGDSDVDMLLGERTGRVLWFRNSGGAGNAFNLALADTNFITPPSVFNATNAAPAVYNFNNDSLPDMLVGYYYGGVKLFINNGTKSKPQYTASPGNAWGMRANHFYYDNSSSVKMESFGYAVPSVADIDHDGNDDILLGASYGRLLLYHPAGRSVMDSLDADTQWLWQRSKKISDSIVPDFGSRVVAVAMDLDGDTMPEVLVGNSRGGLNLASAPGSKTAATRTISYSKPEIKVFPNPAKDKITVARKSTGGNWQINIYDILGNKLYSTRLMNGESNITISIPNMPNGIYIAEAINGNQRTVIKFSVYNN